MLIIYINKVINANELIGIPEEFSITVQLFADDVKCTWKLYMMLILYNCKLPLLGS